MELLILFPSLFVGAFVFGIVAYWPLWYAYGVNDAEKGLEAFDSDTIWWACMSLPYNLGYRKGMSN